MPRQPTQVTVDQPRSRLDAELRRGALEAAGITVRIATDDAGGMHPHLGPSAAGIRLLVPADQAGRARELLVDLDAGRWALGDDEPA